MLLRVSQSRASTKGRILHATFVLARRILGEEVKFPACLAVLFIICQRADLPGSLRETRGLSSSSPRSLSLRKFCAGYEFQSSRSHLQSP